MAAQWHTPTRTDTAADVVLNCEPQQLGVMGFSATPRDHFH